MNEIRRMAILSPPNNSAQLLPLPGLEVHFAAVFFPEPSLACYVPLITTFGISSPPQQVSQENGG